MIIALNGGGRVGKDTGCRIIKDLLQPSQRPVYREGFADRLKTSAAAALGIPVELLESLKDSGRITIERKLEDPYEQGADPAWEFVQSLGVRRYMERYGTEAHRDVFDQDFWIDIVMQAHFARSIEDPTAVTVITDCRFPNEAAEVLHNGGQVWEIIRSGYTLESDHPSNQPLPRELVSRTIMNDSGLAEFRYALAIAVRDTFGVAVAGPAS